MKWTGTEARPTLFIGVLLAFALVSPALSANPTLEEISSRMKGPLVEARALAEKGRHGKAVDVLKAALQRREGSAEEPAMLLALGNAYAAQKERTFALAAYDKLLAKHPRSDLADDAQFAKALLELTELPSPGHLLEAIESFATFNPLTLDPDVIHHILGVERGYRLDRIGKAIDALQETWQRFPEGDRAADALLRQAVLEGFLLSRRGQALSHLERLEKSHPSSSERDRGLVMQGFLELLEGRAEEAARVFARVPAGSELLPHAAFLAGTTKAYILGDLPAGRPHFQELTRAAGPLWRSLGHYHLALNAFSGGEGVAAARAHLKGVGDSKSSPRVATWRDALSRALDRVERAATPAQKRLAAAEFWRQSGHNRRAAAELEELIDREPGSPPPLEISAPPSSGPSGARPILELGPTAPDPARSAGLPEVPQAHLELGRIYSEGPSSRDRARAHFDKAAAHPVPEVALEAKWRSREEGLPGRPAPRLESLVREGQVWRSRAAAQLARAASRDPAARGRLLRQLEQREGNREERLRGLRDLADTLAEAERWRPALDLHRRLLPEDPSLRDRMIELAALEARAGLGSAAKSEGRTGPAAPTLDRALRVASQLRAAGKKEEARELLREVAALPAQTRLLVWSLEDAPLDLADLGRVNRLLEEKGLAEADRNELLEWKARILEKEGVEGQKALDLYRYLVEHGHRAEALSIRLAERAVEAGKHREALTHLAKVAASPARDRVEAKAYLGLGQEDVARDRLVRAGAIAELAKLDSTRLERAVRARRDPEDKGEDVEVVLDTLQPQEAPLLEGALDGLVAALTAEAAGGQPSPRPSLVDRLISLYEEHLKDAVKLSELYTLRLAAPGGDDASDKIGLARAMARTGQARKAYEMLEGLGPEAALEQARLLRGELGDVQRGLRQLEGLSANRKLPAWARAAAARQLAVLRRGEKDEQSALLASVAAEPKATAAADAHARLAELAAARGEAAVAARHREAAAGLLPGEARGWELGLQAAQGWLDAGEAAGAVRVANTLLGRGVEADVPERARRILTAAAGLQQLDAFEKTVDQDDPANPANYERLLGIARVQATMLSRHDEAETTLLAIEEQFSDKAASPEVQSLRATIARDRAILRNEQLGAKGLVAAGLMREEANDPRGAALDYARAIASEDGKGPMTLLARLYLARVAALHLGDRNRAARLAAEAAELDGSGPFSAMIATAQALARTGKPAGDWRALARAAAGELQDPVLLAEALGRAPAQAYREAIELAGAIDPLRAVTPLGPGVAELLERAVELAPAGEPKAVAQLALADWRREQGEPERAAQAYERAEKAAPGTKTAREAAVKRGSLLEGDLADAASAAKAYEPVSRGEGPFQQIAAARLPIVLARKDAEEAEKALEPAQARQSPQSYLAAARRQAKDTGQLDRSLENYRAFLRTSSDPKLLATAYREAAEVLVRADKPRDAVEMLERLLERRLPGVSQASTLLRMAEILELNLAELEEAKRFYREVETVAPDSPEARTAHEGLERIEDTKHAKARAEKAGTSDVAAGEELAAIRKKYLQGADKDPEGAAEAIRQQIAVTADDAQKAKLYQELSRIEEEDLQQFSEAAESLGKAIDLMGKGDRAAELTLRLATLVSERLKQPKKAMELYDGWMKTYYAHPKKVAVMLERGRLLEAALDNAQQAIDIYRYIANAHPRSGYDEQALLRIAHLSRAYFADHLGAVDAFDQIARRFPFGPNAQTALFQAAQISEIELGDLNRAIAFYNRLVSTYPTTPLANDARNALARIERRRR